MTEWLACETGDSRFDLSNDSCCVEGYVIIPVFGEVKAIEWIFFFIISCSWVTCAAIAYVTFEDSIVYDLWYALCKWGSLVVESSKNLLSTFYFWFPRLYFYASGVMPNSRVDDYLLGSWIMPEPAPLIGESTLLLSLGPIETLRLDTLFELYLYFDGGSSVTDCLFVKSGISGNMFWLEPSKRLSRALFRSPY